MRGDGEGDGLVTRVGTTEYHTFETTGPAGEWILTATSQPGVVLAPDQPNPLRVVVAPGRRTAVRIVVLPRCGRTPSRMPAHWARLGG